MAALASVALVAGCSESNDDKSTIELRSVDASADGPCTVESLESDAAGSACGAGEAKTYELGELLGVVLGESAEATSDSPSVTVRLDADSIETWRTVTAGVMGNELALLSGGRVLAATTVMAPATSGAIELAFDSASKADEFVASLEA